MRPTPVVTALASPPSPPVAATAGKTLKPGWGECPPEGLPLRAKQPGFRAATGERLVRFGLGQPVAVGAWLLARADAYFARDKGQLMTAEATACLDLLVWQSGGMADRAALDRLPTPAELDWKKNGELCDAAPPAASKTRKP